ncbi:hypothetical protein Tco_0379161 [Tanacetum coccineum]
MGGGGGSVVFVPGTVWGGVVKVARCRPSVLVIVAVVSGGGPIAVKTRSYGALTLPEACLEICLEAWSLCFFACGVRWVKFPCFVILDFGSVLSVGSHGWRQSVDTKVGRSLISGNITEFTVCDDMAHEFAGLLVERMEVHVITVVSSCRVSRYRGLHSESAAVLNGESFFLDSG